MKPVIVCVIHSIICAGNDSMPVQHLCVALQVLSSVIFLFSFDRYYFICYRDKIVISDIDGTITRSDVRGMFLPYIGVATWAQVVPGTKY